MVVCLSKAAAERSWIEAERDATLIQQFRERKERILPVRLEDVAPPYVVAQLEYVDLFPDERAFVRGIARLTGSIEAYQARQARTAEPLGPANASSAQPSPRSRPVPAYPDAEVEALSKQLEEARIRRDKLRAAGIATGDVDREILELRRQLREGGRLRPEIPLATVATCS